MKPTGPTDLERLRRELYNDGRPSSFVCMVQCSKEYHPLLWLVRAAKGIVPIANRHGRYDFGTRTDDSGERLLTLAEWPDRESMPLASCSCFPQVEISLEQVEDLLRGQRDRASWPF